MELGESQGQDTLRYHKFGRQDFDERESEGRETGGERQVNVIHHRKGVVADVLRLKQRDNYSRISQQQTKEAYEDLGIAIPADLIINDFRQRVLAV